MKQRAGFIPALLFGVEHEFRTPVCMVNNQAGKSKTYRPIGRKNEAVGCAFLVVHAVLHKTASAGNQPTGGCRGSCAQTGAVQQHQHRCEVEQANPGQGFSLVPNSG